MLGLIDVKIIEVSASGLKHYCYLSPWILRYMHSYVETKKNVYCIVQELFYATNKSGSIKKKER